MDNLQKFNRELEEFFVCNRRHLINKIYPYIKSYDVAEEIVQDAFLKAITNPEALNLKRGTLKTWLNSILFSTLWDYKRKARKEHVLFSNEEPLDIGEHIEEKMSSLLCEVVNVFHRRILSLKFEYGYSYKEIADLLKINIHNVKKIVQRFKKSFVLEG